MGGCVITMEALDLVQDREVSLLLLEIIEREVGVKQKLCSERTGMYQPPRTSERRDFVLTQMHRNC